MPITSACPTPDELHCYLLGDLSEDVASAVEAHLSTCEGCRLLLPGIGAEDPLVEALRVSGRSPRTADPVLGNLTAQLKLLSGPAVAEGPTCASAQEGEPATPMPREDPRLGEKWWVPWLTTAAVLLAVATGLLLSRGWRIRPDSRATVPKVPRQGGAGGNPGGAPEDPDKPTPIETGAPLEATALVSRPTLIKGLKSWSIKPGATRGGVRGLTLTQEGQRLILSTEIGGRWDWDVGKAVSLPLPPAGPPSFRGTSPDGKIQAVPDDHTIKLVEVASKKVLRRLRDRHLGVVRDVQWSPDSRWLLVQHSNGTMIYRAIDWKKALEMQGQVNSVSWSPDDKKALFACNLGAARLVTFTGTPTFKTLSQGAEWAGPWSPSGEYTLCLEHSSPAALVKADGSFVARCARHVTTRWAVWSPDSTLLAYGGPGCSIVLLDVETATVKRELCGHGRDITALAFTPDGKTLISSSSDETVRFWDVETGLHRGTLIVLKDGWLALSPEGHYRCSPTADTRFLYIFETSDGKTGELSPKEFRKKYGWKNNPDRVKLTP